MTNPTQAPRNELAVIRQEVVGGVERRIRELVDGKQLQLPPSYSASNALQAAWLVLQEVKTKDGKLAIESCSRNSVANALFSMVVQGLDVGKKQGYFIAYGRALVFQRSYFGTLAVARRSAGVRDAYAQIIYEGDTFEYGIQRGRKVVSRHTQTLENIDTAKIRGAYAVVTFVDEARPEVTEVMTFPQIQKAWSKGQGKNMAREEFPDQMSIRTVLNRALKVLINSSDDAHLGLENPEGDAAAVAEVDAEREALREANGEVIDIDADVEDGAGSGVLDGPETQLPVKEMSVPELLGEPKSPF